MMMRMMVTSTLVGGINFSTMTEKTFLPPALPQKHSHCFDIRAHWYDMFILGVNIYICICVCACV